MPVTINGSDGITNASWTTGTRPSNPAAGQMGYNTETNALEFYDDNSGEWAIVRFDSEISATGGSVSTITQNGVSYRVHEFTSTGTSSFNIVSGSGTVEYLIVAGGGGGGKQNGAGGGAGGVVKGSIYLAPESYPQSYTIEVGDGGPKNLRDPGTGNGRNNEPRNQFPLGIRGEDSAAFGLIAIGGGNGGGDDFHGAEGGSAGAGADDPEAVGGFSVQNAVGSPGFGNNGGDSAGADLGIDGTGGGGGGGASQPGFNIFAVNASDNRRGGDGVRSDITGTPIFYAGGGGGGQKVSGGTPSGPPGGLGGRGGGGGGGTGTDDDAENGAPNTGGGGGGGADSGDDTGAGGSGIVIVRYRIG